jgi:hypothetical protein
LLGPIGFIVAGLEKEREGKKKKENPIAINITASDPLFDSSLFEKGTNI